MFDRTAGLEEAVEPDEEMVTLGPKWQHARHLPGVACEMVGKPELAEKIEAVAARSNPLTSPGTLGGRTVGHPQTTQM